MGKWLISSENTYSKNFLIFSLILAIENETYRIQHYNFYPGNLR